MMCRTVTYSFVATLHTAAGITSPGFVKSTQSCSQYSVIQVPVLESQVPVPVPMSQVQVQVPVLRFQVPVPVPL